MIGQLSGIIITVPFLIKFTYTSFRPSLETDIKFKHKLDVCRALFRVTFQLTLSIYIYNCIDPLPKIVKVESLLAERC